VGVAGGFLLIVPIAGAVDILRFYELSYVLNPLPFLAIAGVLALLAIAASFAPARRVMAIDPVQSLRAE
jgi:ABC-type lipoprotein release transport system permease subunit